MSDEQRTFWRSTIVIWSDTNPSRLELSELARDAESGDSICTYNRITSHGIDTWDPTFQDAAEFFDITDELDAVEEARQAQRAIPSTEDLILAEQEVVRRRDELGDEFCNMLRHTLSVCVASRRRRGSDEGSPAYPNGRCPRCGWGLELDGSCPNPEHDGRGREDVGASVAFPNGQCGACGCGLSDEGECTNPDCES